jgi:hypothetical protein
MGEGRPALKARDGELSKKIDIAYESPIKYIIEPEIQIIEFVTG